MNDHDPLTPDTTPLPTGGKPPKVVVVPLLAVWKWQSLAACRDMDTSVFFSPPGERGSARRHRESTARAVCAACPVRTQCARFAVACGQRYGVWGGLTEADRRSLAPTDPVGRPVARTPGGSGERSSRTP
ncbi:WhiB family transcriptional regulator [Streptomyces sp. NPDC052023]|uniref:WhiB family transcriptional regulator n=1 Tax=Streptomyces sp. NPDC052023 TaxID=3365681 RepID=UPI0037D86462